MRPRMNFVHRFALPVTIALCPVSLSLAGPIVTHPVVSPQESGLTGSKKKAKVDRRVVRPSSGAALPAVPLIVTFGAIPWVLACYELLDVAVTLWSHSNLRVPERLDRILRRVIVTPDLHRIHHSAWKTETNSNFGAVFPIWDLVFGTFRATSREPHERMRLGLDERRGHDAHRPLWLLVSVVVPSLGESSQDDDGVGKNARRQPTA